MRAFGYEGTGDYPTAFVGYGETTLNVTDGDVVDNVPIAMTPPATKTLTGTFAPSNYTGTLGASVVWLPRDTAGGEESWSMPAQSPFSLVVPIIPGATLYGWYYGSGSDYLAPTAAGVLPFVIPGAPTLNMPAAGATFTPGMTFGWTPPPGATGIYRFSLVATNQDPWLFIWTKATSVTVPASFVPKAGKPYSWDVSYYQNASTVDAVTKGDPLAGGMGSGRAITIP